MLLLSIANRRGTSPNQAKNSILEIGKERTKITAERKHKKREILHLMLFLIVRKRDHRKNNSDPFFFYLPWHFLYLIGLPVLGSIAPQGQGSFLPTLRISL